MQEARRVHALPTGHLCARCVVTANGTMQQRLVSNRRLIERLLWLMAFRGAGHEPDGTWQPLPPPEELLPPILPVQVGGITDTPAPVPE